MHKNAALVGLALMFWFLPDAAFGQMRKHAWEFDVYAGQVAFASELELDNGEIGGIRVAWNITDFIGFEISADRTTTLVEEGGGSLFPFLLPGQTISMEARTYKADLVLNMRSSLRRWRGFALFGIGSIEFDPRNPLPPGVVQNNTESTLVDFGGGARYFIKDWISLRGDGRVEYAPGDTFTNARVTLGVSFHLGGKSPRDIDEDGVSDVKDTCPDTKLGATVDAHGCPSDSDGDLILDGLDDCPDTPEGWPIDDKGCPTDIDGDGVVDGADECADTPTGAVVDDLGCPIDTDEDGHYDGLDACPGTPIGAVVDETGCPMDTDGDEVIDGLDLCPDTPKKVVVDEQGCPIDSDEDGIFDGLDQCTGSAPGTIVDETGCPRIRPAVGEKLILEGITFTRNGATLEEDSYPILEEILVTLQYFEDWRFEIQGHTDSDGTIEINQLLSDQRADTVRQWFVSRGIASSRLTAKGYGEASPISDNLTDIGKQRNRRVELLRTR